jgi:hypothetical protein
VRTLSATYATSPYLKSVTLGIRINNGQQHMCVRTGRCTWQARQWIQNSIRACAQFGIRSNLTRACPRAALENICGTRPSLYAAPLRTCTGVRAGHLTGKGSSCHRNTGKCWYLRAVL